jgi:3D (Asp-Asp-Asp) domain-containing protein
MQRKIFTNHLRSIHSASTLPSRNQQACRDDEVSLDIGQAPQANVPPGSFRWWDHRACRSALTTSSLAGARSAHDRKERSRVVARSVNPPAGNVPSPAGRHSRLARRSTIRSLRAAVALTIPLGSAGAALVASAAPAVAAPALSSGSVVGIGDANTWGAPASGGGDLAGVAETPGDAGFWVVTPAGAVTAYGDAANYGSVTTALRAPIVGIAATPDGHGYWLVGADGGIFSFGDAGYFGSLGGQRVTSHIVGMADSVSGNGYWLVAADGGVFSFGDAAFAGSAATERLAASVTGVARTPDGRGYWLVAADGGVFSFGDAGFFGSLAGHGAASAVVTMASTADGGGYWLMQGNGVIHPYGDAGAVASAAVAAGASVTAIAPTSDGQGYLATTGTAQSTGQSTSAEVVGQSLGSYVVTCYDLRGRTADGDSAGMESVAVDPRVIPLGSHIDIPGVGIRTADDTGGAIIGHHIDIWEPSASACANWGVQDRTIYRVS